MSDIDHAARLELIADSLTCGPDAAEILASAAHIRKTEDALSWWKGRAVAVEYRAKSQQAAVRRAITGAMGLAEDAFVEDMVGAIEGLKVARAHLAERVAMTEGLDS
jgi:hypothetical protein